MLKKIALGDLQAVRVHLGLEYAASIGQRGRKTSDEGGNGSQSWEEREEPHSVWLGGKDCEGSNECGVEVPGEEKEDVVGFYSQLPLSPPRLGDALSRRHGS